MGAQSKSDAASIDIVQLTDKGGFSASVPVWKRARKSLVKARWPLVSLVILSIVTFLSIFGPLIAPKDPNRQALVKRLQPPASFTIQGGSEFLLGTDSLGRDVLSRLIYGARVSIFVGAAAVMIGGTLGTSVGVIAGYFGGYVDDIIMRLGEIQLAYPATLFAIMMLVVLGPGIPVLVLVLGFSQWVTYARIARGQTLSQREKEYVEAARCMGARDREIILRAILPNVFAPIVVIASFNVAGAILTEAALSFLGLGVPPSVPTWGSMLAESRDTLIVGVWWLAVFPGLAIMLTVLAINILGDWLRDFLDPRLRGRG